MAMLLLLLSSKGDWRIRRALVANLYLIMRRADVAACNHSDDAGQDGRLSFFSLIRPILLDIIFPA